MALRSASKRAIESLRPAILETEWATEYRVSQLINLKNFVARESSPIGREKVSSMQFGKHHRDFVESAYALRQRSTSPVQPSAFQLATRLPTQVRYSRSSSPASQLSPSHDKFARLFKRERERETTFGPAELDRTLGCLKNYSYQRYLITHSRHGATAQKVSMELDSAAVGKGM